MKANHKCKYSKCTLGSDGGRKEYYACPHCDASQSWRSMACCKEHYDLYVEEVLAARAHGDKVNLLPDRTDMGVKETKDLVNMPLDKALEATKEELKDYAEDIEELGVSATVDKINDEIDRQNTKTKRTTRKKN